MRPNEFRVSVKYRLGVPVYHAERKCPFCKRVIGEETQLLDTTGFEAKQ